jgi:hypothetical protein
VSIEAWHLTELTEVAAVCLSLALRFQGKDLEARRVMEETLELRPGSARLHGQLLDLLVKQGLTEESLCLFDQIQIDPRRRGSMREAVRGACAAARGEWAEALVHLQGAYAHGCTDAFCLRWLSTALVTTGHVEAAEPVLRQWQQVAPGNPELKLYLAMVAPEECQELPADEQPRRSGQRIRIDPAQSVLAMPIGLPIVAQATSAGR